MEKKEKTSRVRAWEVGGEEAKGGARASRPHDHARTLRMKGINLKNKQ